MVAARDVDDAAPLRPGRVGPFLVLIALGVIGVPALAGLHIELKWFRALGHIELFTTVFWSRLLIGAGVGLATGLVVFLNLRLAVTRAQGLRPLYLYDPDGIPRVNLGDVVARLVVPASATVAILTGLYHYPRWVAWQLYLHRTSFGVADPVLGRDVGFYVLELPLWSTLCGLALWVLGITAAGVAALYLTRGAIALGEGETGVHRAARAHLGVIAAVGLGVLAFRTYLDMFETMYSTVGPITGASYADVNAKLPALRIEIGLTAVAAVLVLASIGREGLGLVILASVVYFAGQLGVRAYPAMVHRFSVLPNELEREAPYIKFNIQATRAALGLDRVQERELSAKGALTAEAIAENASTIENVRLWDHEPLLDTFAQIQEIRTYYDFASVDNDRYVIDGKLRQTMLSARELSSASLPNRTWINERFVFTHGYGLTLGPVNEATAEGLPVLMVQDIPPVSKSPSLHVTQPAIYFGELSNDHVFVRTRNREFDFPSVEGTVETEYEGEDGIRFDSILTRLALAIRLGSLKLLLSNDIDSDSRVLLYRNITERVRRLAPFLELDPDPYMIVRDDGTLTWIYDAYTVTDRYPYAQPTPEGINYIRNSVKIVIDAYHGDVTFFAVDEQDPLLATWRKVFPTSFASVKDMPADVRRHLRYPQLIFQLQAEAFATYHMAQAQLLYNREDQWEIPAIAARDGRTKMEPYYTVMKLPEEDEAEFILMLPYTPKRKDNMAAWMVARSDGDKLGEIIVYRFPKDRLVFGPQQMVNRISQDAEISRQISLWDQRGSEALLGTLLVIPIEESLIYVRPLYLRSEGGKIPELKRVIVAYENQIAMEPSLDAAMEAIFGRPGHPRAALPPRTPAAPPDAHEGAAPAPAATRPSAATTPEAKALEHFERAVAAQRAGDWGGYGREIAAVEALLREMQPRVAPVTVAPSADAGAH